MTKSFALLFQLKLSKKLANGHAPIYLRITIDKERVEVATKRQVDPEKWNGTAQKVTGSSDDVKSLNSHLKTLEWHAYDVYRDMLEKNILITAQSFKNQLTGAGERLACRMLVPIFQDHNRQLEALVGSEYAPATLTRYETTLKHTIAFLKWKYAVTDMNIEQLNHEFVTAFEFYLRSVRNCNNNSAVKYVKNLRKIINICVANNWLTRDPFINYKSKVKEVIRDFLSAEEIQTITEKKMVSGRLGQVRDIFLFSCYTGLAYADVKKLKKSEINYGIDNQKWIFTSCQKTDTPSRIPLLPAALAILAKYEDHRECKLENKLLPVLSNQKTNAYLKEIADICGIEKELTFHIARHTFATTVTLSNGVSIESVSKMLGHRSLHTTQHYAKILDSKVGQDMNNLSKKMDADNVKSINQQVGNC